MIPERIERQFVKVMKALRTAPLESFAVLETKDRKTGEPVYVIVTVKDVGEDYHVTPLAKLFSVNPDKEVEPPEGTTRYDPGKGYEDEAMSDINADKHRETDA